MKKIETMIGQFSLSSGVPTVDIKNDLDKLKKSAPIKVGSPAYRFFCYCLSTEYLEPDADKFNELPCMRLTHLGTDYELVANITYTPQLSFNPQHIFVSGTNISIYLQFNRK